MTPDRPTICNQGKTGETRARRQEPAKTARKHPRPPPLSCQAAHAGAGTRARTSWSINLRTYTVRVSPAQTAWHGQTGRQEKNRSSKTRRGRRRRPPRSLEPDDPRLPSAAPRPCGASAASAGRPANRQSSLSACPDQSSRAFWDFRQPAASSQQAAAIDRLSPCRGPPRA